MTTTQTTTTAADVIAAALAYNDGHMTYDERTMILNGTAGVRVTFQDRAGRNTWLVVVSLGVLDADGGLWLAATPNAYKVRPTKDVTREKIAAIYNKRISPDLPLI